MLILVIMVMIALSVGTAWYIDTVERKDSDSPPLTAPQTDEKDSHG